MRRKRTVHFLNLTNGIESIKRGHVPPDYHFIRIQSTQCEARVWDKVILNLDNNFLMHLALGDKCIVHDYSAHKESPRAIYQGLEFIKYILYRRWFNIEYQMYIRGNKVDMKFYENEYITKVRTNKDVKKKIDYFIKFLLTDQLYIDTIVNNTTLDGNFDEYRRILDY